jgi:2-dehydro-3-deoxy-D-arabinonate dehydratase
LYLSRHETADGPRWALDGLLLPRRFDLRMLLELAEASVAGFLRSSVEAATAPGKLLPPIEPTQEVWAAGVTYLRSREAREAESTVKDVYARVYEAARPELFFKSLGWRVVGHEMPIRVREDSRWNVPEPELVLVVNARGEIVGYCAGNDVSSRDIEGENPLYLPQAKVYDGSCALGPSIVLGTRERLKDLVVRLLVQRAGRAVFEGETHTSQIQRSFEELVAYLGRELSLPEGAFLMTGTGIVPPQDFSLEPGDRVRVTVGLLTLENEVDRGPRAARPWAAQA